MQSNTPFDVHVEQQRRLLDVWEGRNAAAVCCNGWFADSSASRTGPPEGHDLLVFWTLCDVAAADISEHEGDVVLRVHLKNVDHLTPALRAVRVLNVLHPGRPTNKFVT
jgi:hypothetical protein